jgi:hypothetical protein
MKELKASTKSGLLRIDANLKKWECAVVEIA